MKNLPLLFLYHHGPIAAAYATEMSRHGLCPEKILVLVNRRRPGSLFPFLSGCLSAWRAKQQEWKNNYWVRALRLRYPSLYSAVTAAVQRHFDLPDDTFDRMATAAKWLNRWCPDTRTVEIGDYSDDRFKSLLDAEETRLCLYSGGRRIIPRKIIAIPRLKILHVHPGYLPHVRGADGLLWSLFVREKMGASCFYMNAEIDRGDVLLAEEYPPLTVEMPPGTKPDDATLYRFVYAYIDPFLRARLLVKVLSGDLPLSGLPQPAEAGLTYNFMRDEIRRQALGKIFLSRQADQQGETCFGT